MKKYFINFYKDKYGDKVKGEWKLSEEEAEEEKDSYLYRVKLELHWTHMAAIEHDKVVEIANEHNMTIGEVLECV
jgi:hypothetical protein